MINLIQTVNQSHAVIEGYGAIFGERDLNGDIIARGAFSHKLIPLNPHSVRMLYQHNVSEPIGRWLEFKEDRRGLFVRGEILRETRTGRDVWALVQAGALDGLSIGFRANKARKKPGGRELTDIDLWEISIVTFPMALSARISAVRTVENSDLRNGSAATADQTGKNIKTVARRLRQAVRS